MLSQKVISLSFYGDGTAVYVLREIAWCSAASIIVYCAGGARQEADRGLAQATTTGTNPAEREPVCAKACPGPGLYWRSAIAEQHFYTLLLGESRQSPQHLRQTTLRHPDIRIETPVTDFRAWKSAVEMA